MDNDSVIDPPPPNESRRRNLVLLSQHERAPPFRFHTREPPLISNSLKLSLSLSPLYFSSLPPGSIEQSPVPPSLRLTFFFSRRRRSTKCEISRLPFVATHLWSVQSVPSLHLGLHHDLTRRRSGFWTLNPAFETVENTASFLTLRPRKRIPNPRSIPHFIRSSPAPHSILPPH